MGSWASRCPEGIGQQAVAIEEVLARLASGWLSTLCGLVAHTAQGSGGGRTPSDFPLLALGQEDIEEFESAFEGGAP